MTLVSHAIRGEECQTSTRDPGEWPGDRVHRRCRCSKLQLVSVAPRYDGSVTVAAFDVDSSGRSTRPHRPSRLCLSDPRAILYVYTEPGSERTARAAHGYHMNSIRWGSQRRCRECASAGEVWRRRPHFVTGNTTATTAHTLMTNGTDRRAHPGPCGLDGRFRHFRKSPDKERG